MAQVRETADREHRALLDARQPPEGFDLNEVSARKAANRRIDALVKRLGTSSATLRTLAAEYEAKLMDITSKVDGEEMAGYHIESHLEDWLGLSPLHDHPLPWGVKPPADDVSDPHRTFLYRPPFWGFLFSFSWQAEGFAGDRELHLDPPRGFVGNTVRMDCDGADTHDFARAQADAQVAVGFVPPIAGILQVIVDAQCVPPARFDLSIEDNFWASQAAAAQVNWLTISLLRADVTETLLAKMDNSEWSTQGDNLTIQHNRLYPVQHYGAQFLSSQPVGGGESIIVAVGTRSLDYGGVTRMDFHSQSDYRWFISSIQIRIVP